VCSSDLGSDNSVADTYMYGGDRYSQGLNQGSDTTGTSGKVEFLHFT
jgi:hypothetical protein